LPKQKLGENTFIFYSRGASEAS
jgi:hypothetical protein